MGPKVLSGHRKNPPGVCNSAWKLKLQMPRAMKSKRLVFIPRMAFLSFMRCLIEWNSFRVRVNNRLWHFPRCVCTAHNLSSAWLLGRSES